MQPIFARLSLCVVATLQLAFLFTSCEYDHSANSDYLLPQKEEQIDSVKFYNSRHYSAGFKFQTLDTLRLFRHAPFSNDVAEAMLLAEGETDTLTVEPGQTVVVSEIRKMRNRSESDSIAIFIAVNAKDHGWLWENALAGHVRPDGAIAAVISAFPRGWSLALWSLLPLAGLMLLMRRRRQGNSLASICRPFYPRLLLLSVATCSLLHASYVSFAPAAWHEFYYHPMLSPLAAGLPLLMRAFLFTLWCVIVSILATLDDLRTRLPIVNAVFVAAVLTCLSLLLYAVITLTVPIYVGYAVFALIAFLLLRRPKVRA